MYEIQIISSNLLEIRPKDNPLIKVSKDYYGIKSLIIKDKYFSRGVKLELNIKDKNITYRFQIQDIRESEQGYYIYCSQNFNKSYWLILPLFPGTKDNYNDDKHLENTFITDIINIDDKACFKKLRLLYKDIKDNNELYYNLQHNKLLNLESEYHDSYSMFTMALPFSEIYHDDITNLFLEGKYSQFTTSYKLRIQQFFNLNNNAELILMLYRNKKLRDYKSYILDVKINDDNELWSKPDLKREIFNINNLLPDAYEFKE